MWVGVGLVTWWGVMVRGVRGAAAVQVLQPVEEVGRVTDSTGSIDVALQNEAGHPPTWLVLERGSGPTRQRSPQRLIPVGLWAAPDAAVLRAEGEVDVVWHPGTVHEWHVSVSFASSTLAVEAIRCWAGPAKPSDTSSTCPR